MLRENFLKSGNSRKIVLKGDTFMQRSKTSFRKIYEDFKKHYPELKYHTTYWKPYSFSTIEIWLKDGKKYTYDDYSHKLQYTGERWKTYSEPEPKQTRGDQRKFLMNNLSKNLKVYLDGFEMSEKELSNKTGIQTSSLSRYINGSRLPNDKTLQKIADIFGIKTEHLLKGEENE